MPAGKAVKIMVRINFPITVQIARLILRHFDHVLDGPFSILSQLIRESHILFRHFRLIENNGLRTQNTGGKNVSSDHIQRFPNLKCFCSVLIPPGLFIVEIFQLVQIHDIAGHSQSGRSKNHIQTNLLIFVQPGGNGILYLGNDV